MTENKFNEKYSEPESAPWTFTDINGEIARLMDEKYLSQKRCATSA